MAGTGKLPEGKVKDYKLLVLGSFLRESKGLQMAGAGQLPEGKGMGLGLARIITSVCSMT